MRYTDAMWRGIVIGWLLGVATFGLGLTANSIWYEHRIITPASDVEWWIEHEGCDVAGTARVPYVRCPRIRLP